MHKICWHRKISRSSQCLLANTQNMQTKSVHSMHIRPGNMDYKTLCDWKIIVGEKLHQFPKLVANHGQLKVRQIPGIIDIK